MNTFTLDDRQAMRDGFAPLLTARGTMHALGENPAFVDDVLERTSPGGLTVNHVMMYSMEGRLPFGGVDGRGMDGDKVEAGLRQLSNARSAFVQGRPVPMAEAA